MATDVETLRHQIMEYRESFNITDQNMRKQTDVGSHSTLYILGKNGDINKAAGL